MSNLLDHKRLRCLFFGMPCTFSAPILATLRNAPIDLIGVASPAPRLSGPSFRKVLPQHSPIRPTTAHSDPWPWANLDPPRYLIRDMSDPALFRELTALAPDLIVVACFPWLIPEAIVQSASVLAVNVHPSLLPRHRGPDPLFWTFHGGEEVAGVTIHRLTNMFDVGPVIMQSTVMVQEGERLAQLDHQLATVGAELLAVLLEMLPALPVAPLTNPAMASYEGAPRPTDRIVDQTWTVDRARRFIAGVAQSHGPLWYRSGLESVAISDLAGNGNGMELVLANGTLRVATDS